MNSKLFQAIDKIISVGCSFMLLAMTILVILSVFLRYLFSITYMWSEELITMLFIGVSFFGCILAVKEKAHIIVDIFIARLSPKVLKPVSILVSLANIFVQAVIIDASIAWIEATGSSPTPGMHLPSYIFYSILPITCCFIILYELIIIKDTLSRKRGEMQNEHANIVS